MGIVLRARDMFSREIRTQIAGGDGLRKIDLSRNITNVRDDEGGLIRQIFDFAGSLVGFAWGIISFGGYVVTRLWGAIVRAGQFLYQFDWNASDSELATNLQQYNVQIASLWGGLVGRGVGYLSSIVLGGGVALLMPVVGGGALATASTLSILETASEDLIGELRAALIGTASALGAIATTRAYIFIRRRIKQFAPQIFGDSVPEWISQWGEEGGSDWRLSEQLEDRIEQIPSTAIQAFLEEFFDEASETFIEGGFIVAGEIDAAIEASQQQQGPTRALEVIPDERAPGEKLIFLGKEEAVKPQVLGALATHQLIYNREVGTIGALDPEGLQIPEAQRQRLTIVFYSVAQPPFKNPDGSRPIKAEYNVPNPKLTLTWSEIKRACGGANGYLWGPWYATGRFDNRRKMVVYGGSELDAQTRLEELADLSQQTLLTMRTGRMASSGGGAASTIDPKRPTQVYPAYMVATKRFQRFEDEYRQDLEGRSWAEERERILLWPDDPPPNADNIFGDLQPDLQP